MPETESHGALFDEFSAVEAEEWRRAVREDLGGADPDDFLDWSSIEGLSIPAYLRREDTEDLPHVASDATIPPLADADERPANDWTVCQPVSHPDPATANEHARTALDRGASDLRLTYSPSASQDSGLHLTAPEHLTTLLDGIDVRTTGLHLEGGVAAPVLYGALRAHLADEDVDPENLRGSVGYDPVAAFATGQVGDAGRAFALAHDLTDADAFPHFRSASVDGRAYHDAGASAVQALACTLGALTERLARGTEVELPLSTLLDDLQFLVSVSTSYFVEIAKLRALRLLVPQVVEAFADAAGVTMDFGPPDLQIHAETSRRTETIYDPHVSMLRATTEAMAAVLGGCDTLTVRPYDAALRPPDDFGLRIARNVQLILEHEAHFDQVADPAAGSYYIESMTDTLAQRAWDKFQEIEAEGGIIDALRSGTLQQQIAQTRQERRDAIDEREHVLVGTTHYPALGERRRDDLDRPEGSPSSNGTAVAPLPSPALDGIRTALRDGTPFPAITSALQNDESPIAPLPRIRVAEEIESIRLRTEAYAETHDGPPQVLLAPLGPPAARSARATFARNFLGVAGFAIEEPLKFESVDAVADAAVEQNADVVVLCSSNAEYPKLAPSLAAALADRGHDALLGIAGAPDDIDAGDHADFFVHQNSSLNETLTTLQNLLGIPTSEDA
jgi:methylmalonyl-CoA mutase